MDIAFWALWLWAGVIVVYLNRDGIEDYCDDSPLKKFLVALVIVLLWPAMPVLDWIFD
jgi:hypothetical protein